eukprot:COSAG01_NODE_4451_length_5007_cov_5.064181_4_plen_137_part_00
MLMCSAMIGSCGSCGSGRLSCWCRAAGGVIQDAPCSPVSRHGVSIRGSQRLTDARRAAPECARGLARPGEARLLPSACLLPLRLPCGVVCVGVAPPPHHGERMGQLWARTTHTAHHGGALGGRQQRGCPLLRRRAW